MLDTSHEAVGGPGAVVSSHPSATAAGVDALRAGGSAVDALIAAAAAQCVVENGSTSIAGMWISHRYDARSGQTSTVASKIGPAAAEPYDYGAESPAAYGGRAMPVPGWPAGAHRAWQEGGRLAWADLLAPAIALADDGYDLDPATYLRVKTSPMAARTAEGRALWLRDGRYLGIGERVRQPALAGTLRELAAGGPEAFYEGEFARRYVAASRERGGRLTLADMAAGMDRPTVRPTRLAGDFCGYEVATEGALMVYALHLCQAADLGALDQAEATYARFRIMEETLHAAPRYSPATHDTFVDRAYADARIDAVLDGPLRSTTLEHFWSNTNVLVACDGDGGVAWLVHSVNTPTMHGAGIVVGGAYAVRAIGPTHARTGDLLAPGCFTTLALYADGRPVLVAGSPGISCMHAPIAYAVARVQRGLDPLAAVAAPRFALPSALSSGRPLFEAHHPPALFDLLDARGVPYYDCSPTPETGRLSVLELRDGVAHAVQDVRGDGTAAVVP